MSHFTVLVVGDTDIEKQLYPFWELDLSTEEAEKDPRAVFCDIEKEYRKKYKTESVEKVVMPDGRLLYPWDDEFKKTGKIPTHEVPKTLERKLIPYKELYPSFKDYMRDWVGEKADKHGRYGYYHNPNAKWDWYQIGGRWAGFLKLKPGVENFLVGDPGLMTEKSRKGYADQAKKKDIDFEYMRKERAAKAEGTYTLVESLISKLESKVKRMIRCGDEKQTVQIPRIIPWLAYLNGEEYKDLSVDQKRDLYHNQEGMKLWNEAKTNSREVFWLDLEDFQCSKEEYIEKARKSSISTFAVVMDGKWYEHGEMGWWGCVSNEKDDWEEEFYNLLNSIPEETMLTIVDCHI